MHRAAAFLSMCFSVVCAINAAGAASLADSADYPVRPITLVVTFPPGGGTDLLARRLAASLERDLGQSVVVENRSGASGNIGAQAVARAKPDGYTLLVVNSTYAINPGVYRNLGFSPQRDLVGVINVAFVPSVLVTAADSPWRTMRQALEAKDGEPGSMPPAYASCGSGTPQHLAGEMLLRRTDAMWLHVPYRGCGPALAGVLGGNVGLGFVTASSALPFLKGGTLRALAVTSPQRSPLLPHVPTVAEQGLAGYALDQWHGILAPAGTSSAIIERLNGAIVSIVQRPDMARDLHALGYDTTVGSPQDFQAVIRQDIARFTQLTEQMGLRVD
ncbi:ABC transporter substrate-binding protein [Pollutimonas nitritireducens]|uniref:ABC transporter substrate-binding protein n=1 Tax=Pollutimonas nitritireducens TaxID=2045209 RepID=A0A2N4UHE3_9BURK|nr:tripartite tricarboxylate transporter substrate binding protein [Pollutimonas nitritireducens]PLC54446.1 ABC transporter substrate-binding protein [Pollutimonas nitritireducens]